MTRHPLSHVFEWWCGYEQKNIIPRYGKHRRKLWQHELLQKVAPPSLAKCCKSKFIDVWLLFPLFYFVRVKWRIKKTSVQSKMRLIYNRPIIQEWICIHWVFLIRNKAMHKCYQLYQTGKGDLSAEKCFFLVNCTTQALK